MQPIESPAQEHDPRDPDCYCLLCEPGPERSLIQSFSLERSPLYMFKDEKTRYCPWDLHCSCDFCADARMSAWIDRLDILYPSQERKRKIKIPLNLSFTEDGWKEIQILVHLEKIMPTASYDKEFPPFEEYSEKNYTYAPKIPSKIQTDISGAPTKISAAEATLN
ncbi:hypothetical protein PVK06_021386 [Gossypium arboreum]|uniref:Uncharacterized protein n=1 Tax=Gossypium arboreum TaxID=29729 RepID=A0ABR0PQD1_GOSAR|nr:hypothetical protein PVK06_021386 [Gossypium arboreum]